MIYIVNKSEIVKNGDFTIFFYATWMPFLSKMKVMIEKIENEHPSHKFYAVDVDQFKDLIKEYRVSCVPTFTIYNNGRKLDQAEGLILTKAFRTIYRKMKENGKKENKS